MRHYYLEENFESIQGSCGRPGKRSCRSTGNQVAPPHAGQHFLQCEVIGDSHRLSDIQVLGI